MKKFLMIIPLFYFMSCSSDKPKMETESLTVPSDEKTLSNRLKEPAFGNLDYVSDNINEALNPKQGSTFTVTGDTLEFSGPYVDAVRQEAAAGVILSIGDKDFTTSYGHPRPDIAEVHQNPKYLNCLFGIRVPVASIGSGSHDVKVKVLASDKSGYFESPILVTLVIPEK